MYPVIPISPSVGIPTYYLIISLSICLGLIWVTRRASRFHLSTKITLDLSLIIMIGGFIGGRLFHVFYEDFSYYRENPLDVFKIWNGGFVFYGGAFVAGFFSVLYLFYRDRKNLKKYLDLFAPVLSFTYILGRIACFFAGCCYGKYCDLPWSVAGRHPTQAYAVFWEAGVLLILLGVEKTPPSKRQNNSLKKSGSIFFLWMVLHGFGRLLMESFRDDFRGPSYWLSISSWISLAIIFWGGFLLFKSQKQ
ncbi:MAG: prolipoprotein diacylglyceryl transferase [Bdellovibrio sp.]